LVGVESSEATLTKALVLIDTTEASLFVADATENGGPSEWRFSRRNRPKIWDIRREDGMVVISLPETEFKDESYIVSALVRFFTPSRD
jgi:hypothetical protein